jgi:hypothetical protein
VGENIHPRLISQVVWIVQQVIIQMLTPLAVLFVKLEATRVQLDTLCALHVRKEAIKTHQDKFTARPVQLEVIVQR